MPWCCDLSTSLLATSISFNDQCTNGTTAGPMNLCPVNRIPDIALPRCPRLMNYINPSRYSVRPTQDGPQVSVRPRPRCHRHPCARLPAFEVSWCQHSRLWYNIYSTQAKRHLMTPSDFGCTTDGTCDVTKACPPLTQLGCKTTFAYHGLNIC